MVLRAHNGALLHPSCLELTAIWISEPLSAKLRGTLQSLRRAAGLQEHRAGGCKEMSLRCHEGRRWSWLAERNPRVCNDARSINLLAILTGQGHISKLSVFSQLSKGRG